MSGIEQAGDGKRRRYVFTGLIMAGDGRTPWEAWQDAIEGFTAEPGNVPSFEIEELEEDGDNEQG